MSGLPESEWRARHGLGGFPADAFAWTGDCGEPTWYYTFPGIGRGFCSTCGSTLASKGDVEGEVGVTIMSLDNHTALTPEHHSFKADAVP